MTRKQLNALAAQHGATIEDEDGFAIALVAELPRGKRWKCNDCHCITAMSYPGKGATAYVCDTLAEDMRHGTEECWDDDCEYCWPPDPDAPLTPYAPGETAKSAYLASHPESATA